MTLMFQQAFGSIGKREYLRCSRPGDSTSSAEPSTDRYDTSLLPLTSPGCPHNCRARGRKGQMCYDLKSLLTQEFRLGSIIPATQNAGSGANSGRSDRDATGPARAAIQTSGAARGSLAC